MAGMEDITSVDEHRAHLRDHLRRVNATGRPLFIAGEGEGDAVVMSRAAYGELAEQAERGRVLAMVERSLDDIKGGRVRDAKSAIEGIAGELGLELDRRPAGK